MAIEFDLQAALYTALSGNIGADVYDIAPQGAAFPYAAIGRIVLSEMDTQTKQGHAAQIRIHTYSRTGSMKECKDIQAAIYAALHRTELTITGFNNFSLLREDTDCLTDGDGRIHGVCEYRALIESA